MIEEFDEYVLNMPMMDGTADLSLNSVHGSIALDNVPTVSPAARRFADREGGEDAFDFEDADGSDEPASASGETHPFHCEGDVCLDSHSNSDIYHIELGNQSITEPRSLRIVLSNTNPIQVSVSFTRSVCAAVLTY
jgi:hypothetical protein